MPNSLELLSMSKSEPRRRPQVASGTSEEVIRQWIGRFAVNCGQALPEGRVLLWLDELSDVKPEVLERVFRGVLRTYVFNNIPPIGEIRSRIDAALASATQQNAELEWERVVELRRRFFNPDTPGCFSRGMPKLSEQVDRAARASGIFKLQDFDQEQLHVWARKRFIESYVAWCESEQDEFLLPDGEMKRLIADAAGKKQLPNSSGTYEAARAVGEKYRDKMAAMTAMVASMTGRPSPPRPIVVPHNRSQFLRKQAEKLLADSTPEQIREAERLRSL
jgi:hypothetical protein